MKTLSRAFLFACAMLLTVQAYAAGYDPKDVAADAKWLCHIDFDAIRNSPTSTLMWDKKEEKRKERMEAWEKKNAEDNGEEKSKRDQRIDQYMKMKKMMQDRMDAFKEATGFDPRIDLQSCTLYDNDVERHQGVMVLKAFMNKDKFSAHAKTLKDYKSVEDGIASFTAMADTKGAHTSYAAFHGTNTIVFSRELAEVKGALAVLNGQSANLSSSNSDLKDVFRAGTTFGMRANIDDDVKAKLKGKGKCNKMPWMQTMGGVDMFMGENDGKGFFELQLSFNNAQQVLVVKQLADGALGWMTMQAKTDAQKKVLSFVRVTAADSKLVIKWEASTDTIMAVKGW